MSASEAEAAAAGACLFAREAEQRLPLVAGGYGRRADCTCSRVRKTVTCSRETICPTRPSSTMVPRIGTRAPPSPPAPASLLPSVLGLSISKVRSRWMMAKWALLRKPAADDGSGSLMLRCPHAARASVSPEEAPRPAQEGTARMAVSTPGTPHLPELASLGEGGRVERAADGVGRLGALTPPQHRQQRVQTG